MKKSKVLFSFCLISSFLSSCGNNQANNENGEHSNNEEPQISLEEQTKQKMEYCLPYLKDSFTLTGKYNNGSQDFNLTYIYQTSPREIRYKYFEYLDENGVSNGQQSVEVYFKDDEGYAKSYIVDPDNTAKITNVYSQTSSQQIQYNNIFFNPFAALTKDDFNYLDDKAFLSSDIYRTFVDAIYGYTNSLIDDVYAYFTFNGDNIDKFILEFTIDDKEIKYDLTFSNVSNSKVVDFTRKHLSQHDALDKAITSFSTHFDESNPDTFLLEVRQDLNPNAKSTNLDIYFMGDAIYINQMSPLDEYDPLMDDLWLIPGEFGDLVQYTYDVQSKTFVEQSATGLFYEDCFPGLAKGEVASEVFDYIDEGTYLACRDVLASIGPEFINSSFLNLEGSGDEYRIELDQNGDIEGIYFTYTAFFQISGSIKYKDFNSLDVPQSILDSRPITA